MRKRTRGLWQFLIFLIGLAPAIRPAIAEELSRFRYTAEFSEELERGKFYQATLPAEILQKSQPDQSDIRLFDSDNRVAPYVILSQDVMEKIFNFEIVSADKIDSPAAWEVIIKTPETNMSVGRILLTLQNRDFKQIVLVEGSQDQKGWEPVVTAVIFDFSSKIDLRKTDIDFPSRASYRYFRLTFQDENDSDESMDSMDAHLSISERGLSFSFHSIPTKELRLDKVSGKTDRNKDEIKKFDQVDFTDIQALIHKENAEDKSDVIDLEAGVPADRIVFDISNSYFSRKVEVFGKNVGEEDYTRLNTQDIYRFHFGDIQTEKTALLLSSKKYDHYRIRIINQDNPPLNLNRISFRWFRRNIFFIPEKSGPHRLFFGNSLVKKPNYELQQFINPDNWFKQSYLRATLPKSKTGANTLFLIEEVEASRQEKFEKYLMTGVIIFLVFILGIWIFWMLRKMT